MSYTRRKRWKKGILTPKEIDTLSQIGIQVDGHDKHVRNGKPSGYLTLSSLEKDTLMYVSSRLEEAIAQCEHSLLNLEGIRNILTTSASSAAEMRAVESRITSHEGKAKIYYGVHGKIGRYMKKREVYCNVS